MNRLNPEQNRIVALALHVAKRLKYESYRMGGVCKYSIGKMQGFAFCLDVYGNTQNLRERLVRLSEQVSFKCNRLHLLALAEEDIKSDIQEQRNRDAGVCIGCADELNPLDIEYCEQCLMDEIPF